MIKMQFNFKDMFLAPRLGFSGKKIWLQFTGLLEGYLFYLVMTYIALLVDGGFSVGSIWESFGLFPCAFAVGGIGTWSTLIGLVGVIGLLAGLLYSALGVSKVTYQQLRDDEFYPVKDAATVDGLITGMSVKDYKHPKSVAITPGEGQVDFPALMARLGKGGFTHGPLIIETLAPGDLPRTLAEAKKARKFVEELVGGGR